MKTLKGQILLIVVCMTLLSACVCGTVSIINSYSVTRADMYSILTEDSIAHAQKIDITLAQIETSVNTLATIAENTIDDIENFSSGNEAVDEYTSKLQDAALACANHTEGALTYYIRYNPELAYATSGIRASHIANSCLLSAIPSLSRAIFTAYPSYLIMNLLVPVPISV